MDMRSLALVRICTALIILIDLASRARFISVFYGDESTLPSSLLHSFYSGTWAWSLHLLDGGSVPLVAFFFFLNAVAAFMLLTGYKTRYASVATWLLTVSLHNANPIILQGGDVLLRGVLFVGMFLPWGGVFSADRMLSKARDVRATVFSGWTAAFLFQIAFMYYFASFFKDSIEWGNGSAIYYTLSIDQYATPLAFFLLQFPDFLFFLTHAIRWFQHLSLFLLFSPVLTRYVRPIAACALMLMHLAFALCMHLGMFSWIAITALIGFLPGELWENIARILRPRFPSVARHLSIQGTDADPVTHQTKSKRVLQFVLSACGILYIAYLFAWQATDVIAIRGVPQWDVWEIPAKVLRIEQRWNLFAPSPYKDDGWFVVPGFQSNGGQVDLYRNGATLTFERPENLYALYPSTRWRKYGIELRRDSNAWLLPYYADYLCRSWNGTYDSGKRMDALEIIYMEERTPPPGVPAEPASRQSLLSWECKRPSL